ncbi:hypothetical protein DCO58_06770 [Helicobacter saguini]|uniref:TolC family protein n=1 Tax=Helicobacter saguini TaxID=1548018 RepID=A0A347VMZ4_9HELI|nr:TolC family protein [Helicobacter saguini]MWV61964.1 hypothetical protein [Helicobacter saguini]MWV67361.1 hypothetical protein [Helicobacter saguini]MWV69714.1 hypothetical protein [Helicobacter saguini]MWV73069.1 hypothetical protein [Helicobacter saguini]TLD95558.1 TolC family protein [Helicobacter saguini]
MKKVIFFIMLIFLQLFSQTHNHSQDSNKTDSTKNTKENPSHTHSLKAFYNLKALENNEKIKQLNYEIQAIESRAKAAKKWDNPRLNFGYNNAEITQPFNLNANDMQNIFIGIEQSFDLNGKRKILANTLQKEAQIKLLELKNLKNQYIFSLISNAININKNKEILNATNNAIHNVNVVLESLKSSNYNPLQLQKLNILKAKLQMKQNEINNILKSAHISISETSFESVENIDIKDILSHSLNEIDYEKVLDSILKNNYEIKAEILRESISNDLISSAKSQFLPDLNIGFTYMYRTNRSDMFGLNFSLPLAIFGTESAKVAESKSQNLIAKSLVLETQNRVKHNVYSLFNDYKTLSENLSLINKVLLPSNEQIINLYSHHATSQANLFQEFYNALNDKVEAEILRLEILAKMNIIYWNLLSLSGE